MGKKLLQALGENTYYIHSFAICCGEPQQNGGTVNESNLCFFAFLFQYLYLCMRENVNLSCASETSPISLPCFCVKCHTSKF